MPGRAADKTRLKVVYRVWGSQCQHSGKG